MIQMMSKMGFKGLAVALLLLPSLCAFSQVERSLLVGGGSANVLDTYLAPYSYTGTNARLQYLTSRPIVLSGHSLMRHTEFDTNGSSTKNHVGNINGYGFGIYYGFGLSRQQSVSDRFTVEYGPTLSTYIGGAYIDRSGNNPGNAHANIMIGASARATYSFPVRSKQWSVEASLAVPLLGAAFSPRYGQSYYETFSLGDYDRNIVLATPVSMPSARYRLMLNIPYGHHKSAFRIGYAGQVNQSTFHHLRHHYYTHDFMIGYSKTLYRR